MSENSMTMISGFMDGFLYFIGCVSSVHLASLRWAKHLERQH